MPALLTSTSKPPNERTAQSTTFAAALSSETSALTNSTPWLVSLRSLASCRPRSPSQSANTTCAPSPMRRRTVASPMPDAPPVTTATLPEKRLIAYTLFAAVCEPAQLSLDTNNERRCGSWPNGQKSQSYSNHPVLGCNGSWPCQNVGSGPRSPIILDQALDLEVSAETSSTWLQRNLNAATRLIQPGAADRRMARHDLFFGKRCRAANLQAHQARVVRRRSSRPHAPCRIPGSGLQDRRPERQFGPWWHLAFQPGPSLR